MFCLFSPVKFVYISVRCPVIQWACPRLLGLSCVSCSISMDFGYVMHNAEEIPLRVHLRLAA